MEHHEMDESIVAGAPRSWARRETLKLATALLALGLLAAIWVVWRWG